MAFCDGASARFRLTRLERPSSNFGPESWASRTGRTRCRMGTPAARQ